MVIFWPNKLGQNKAFNLPLTEGIRTHLMSESTKSLTGGAGSDEDEEIRSRRNTLSDLRSLSDAMRSR